MLETYVENQLERPQEENESVLNEIGADREFVTTIKKQKLQYFSHMI